MIFSIFQGFPPLPCAGVVFDGMNILYSSRELKLPPKNGKISGSIDIVEEPNIDANKMVHVDYTVGRRKEGTVQ